MVLNICLCIYLDLSKSISVKCLVQNTQQKCFFLFFFYTFVCKKIIVCPPCYLQQPVSDFIDLRPAPHSISSGFIDASCRKWDFKSMNIWFKWVLKPWTGKFCKVMTFYAIFSQPSTCFWIFYMHNVVLMEKELKNYNEFLPSVTLSQEYFDVTKWCVFARCLDIFSEKQVLSVFFRCYCHWI